jgi:hypothetical protein
MSQRLPIWLWSALDLKANERGQAFLASLFAALLAYQRKQSPGIDEREVIHQLLRMTTCRRTFEYGTSRTEQEWEEYVSAERERQRRHCFNSGKGSQSAE